jgi:hypothetical protein
MYEVYIFSIGRVGKITNYMAEREGSMHRRR